MSDSRKVEDTIRKVLQECPIGHCSLEAVTREGSTHTMQGLTYNAALDIAKRVARALEAATPVGVSGQCWNCNASLSVAEGREVRIAPVSAIYPDGAKARACSSCLNWAARQDELYGKPTSAPQSVPGTWKQHWAAGGTDEARLLEEIVGYGVGSEVAIEKAAAISELEKCGYLARRNHYVGDGSFGWEAYALTAKGFDRLKQIEYPGGYERALRAHAFYVTSKGQPAAGTRDDGIEAAIDIVRTEEECPGEPPAYVVDAMEKAGPVMNARAAVRATKKSIIERLRSLKSTPSLQGGALTIDSRPLRNVTSFKEAFDGVIAALDEGWMPDDTFFEELSDEIFRLVPDLKPYSQRHQIENVLRRKFARHFPSPEGRGDA